MKRRDFIAAAGAALALPGLSLAARAQSPAPPVIGLLDTSADTGDKLAMFYQGLKTEGFVRGQNVAVEYRAAHGDYSRLPAMAAELIARKIAVLATIGTPAAQAAKAATTTIPIVFTIATDPVQIGLVGSLNRPGGNITGVTNMGLALEAKRLELLHALMPTASNLALLINPANVNADDEASLAATAAGQMAVKVEIIRANNESDLDPAFEKLKELRANGLAIGTDSLFLSNSEQLAAIALRQSVPAVFQYRQFAAAGGLMSYGGNPTEIYHQVGAYSGLVLKGAKPADLPVFRATQVELIINLKTAKAFGLTVPLTLLGRADQVIE
jgi:putative tryptophan/tyrosine transport system substrate-binding protein